jgi:hypothetical protein
MSNLSLVYSSSVTLNDAQIKALPTTPFEVVPALGAGIMIYPMHCLFALNSVADYTNIDTEADMGIVAAVSGVGMMDRLIETSPLNQVSGLLANGGNSLGFTAGNTGSFVLFTEYINRAQMLTLINGALGNLTGGNVANS